MATRSSYARTRSKTTRTPNITKASRNRTTKKKAGVKSQEYEVEAIIGVAPGTRDGTGHRKFLIAWVGFDEKTWEPEENLPSSLVSAFCSAQLDKATSSDVGDSDDYNTSTNANAGAGAGADGDTGADEDNGVNDDTGADDDLDAGADFHAGYHEEATTRKDAQTNVDAVVDVRADAPAYEDNDAGNDVNDSASVDADTKAVSNGSNVDDFDNVVDVHHDAGVNADADVDADAKNDHVVDKEAVEASTSGGAADEDEDAEDKSDFDSGGVEYEVERIIGATTEKENGVTIKKYLVAWVGYVDQTWEPEDHLPVGLVGAFNNASSQDDSRADLDPRAQVSTNISAVNATTFGRASKRKRGRTTQLFGDDGYCSSDDDGVQVMSSRQESFEVWDRDQAEVQDGGQTEN
jgi:hypothetical protein